MPAGGCCTPAVWAGGTAVHLQEQPHLPATYMATATARHIACRLMYLSLTSLLLGALAAAVVLVLLLLPLLLGCVRGACGCGAVLPQQDELLHQWVAGQQRGSSETAWSWGHCGMSLIVAHVACQLPTCLCMPFIVWFLNLLCCCCLLSLHTCWLYFIKLQHARPPHPRPLPAHLPPPPPQPPRPGAGE
jgi:hypothetical protein